MNNKPNVVNSVAVSFKRALKTTEDTTKAKKDHRDILNCLVVDYLDKVNNGTAEGIRNARDLVEIMKMDLLLMGEATDRIDNTNTLDEIRVRKVAQALDLSNSTVQDMINTVMNSLNDANDEADSHIMDGLGSSTITVDSETVLDEPDSTEDSPDE